MSDLTTNAPLRFRHPTLLKVEKWTLDNSAAQTLYRGQPAIIDGSADTLYVRGWLGATSLSTTNDIFIGIINEGPKVVATTDVETNNEIELIVGGEVGFKSSVFTDADVGKVVTMSDSGTLSSSAPSSSKLGIGHLTRVVDGYAYVELYGYPNIQP